METFQRQSVIFLGLPVFLLQNKEEGKLCVNLKTCACEGTFHLNLETWGGGQGKASSAGPPPLCQGPVKIGDKEFFLSNLQTAQLGMPLTQGSAAGYLHKQKMPQTG